MPKVVTASLVCTEQATFDIVTLEEAKLQAKVDQADEDALLMLFIGAAREYAERTMNRVLRASVWEWTFSGFPYAVTRRHTAPVPLAPCSECAAVTVDGNTVAPSLYAFTASGKGSNESPLRASLSFLPGFPAGEKVTATITAGWTQDDLPPAIKTWALIRIATWYGQRDTIAAGVNSVQELKRDFIDAILDPFIIPR